ncbi:MAG TPA: molybdopterin-dependent oxidoreductase [Dyella sp.]|uniref:SorA family sulfite dehydrogenase catalytic subunit n=1 Tax=Dyella sp. TaxID=1869338 RepID=UPI002F92B018
MSQFDPSRRRAFKALGYAGAGLLSAPLFADTRIRLPFENGERELAAFPGKRPMIVLTQRPPQLETPFSVFNDGLITPNDAFFVRYHWSGLPLSVDPTAFRLQIHGQVERPLQLTLSELKSLGNPVELIAINQCSGNSRGHFSPRVNGGQLHHGAMGNARWTGVPLKRVLDAAGVRAGAKQVVFDGLDRPPLPNGPDFIKALDVDHARDGEVMIAWSMNGEDLPLLNGYPLRLIVPGYYGTYWVKHLNDIEVIDKEFDGFWMSKAYRIAAPKGAPDATVPINRMNVRSFLTSLIDGARIPMQQAVVLRGIAFDGGSGIAAVDVSTDGGQSWQAAELGRDTGRYGFQEWTFHFVPAERGTYRIQTRARNRRGDVQPRQQNWNAAGYMRNMIETTTVLAT